MADVSKIKLENDIYDIKDSTARNNKFISIPQNDFLTLDNNYTIIQYDVMANSNTLYGHIIVRADNTPFGNYNSNAFTVKAPYQPKNLFYKNCFLGSAEWSIDNFGYYYQGGSIAVIVSKNGNYNYAILDFIYQI